MKKILAALSALALVFSLASCNTSKPDEETTVNTEVVVSEENSTQSNTVAGDTIGSKYVSAFNSSSETDPDKIVDELISLDIMETQLVKMEVQPGYLNGFDDEIKGFDKGVMFSPMIGSIPFVGYVFETQDTDSLLETLKSSANTRWLICTEADETVSVVSGNLVLFLMCANETDDMQ